MVHHDRAAARHRGGGAMPAGHPPDLPAGVGSGPLERTRRRPGRRAVRPGARQPAAVATGSPPAQDAAARRSTDRPRLRRSGRVALTPPESKLRYRRVPGIGMSGPPSCSLGRLPTQATLLPRSTSAAATTTGGDEVLMRPYEIMVILDP